MDLSGLSSSITSTSANASNSANRISADFNNFLKLLTTQLKNQDPLDPLDTNQFTQQLVSFAGVEQQIITNDSLKNITNLNQVSQQSTALSYMGNTAEVAGDTFYKEGTNTKFSYYVPADAKDVTIQILNKNGDVIKTVDGEAKTGRHEFVWDGKDEQSVARANGEFYGIKVTANDETGKALEGVITAFYGTVTGVQFNGSEVTLNLNGVYKGLDSVVSVSKTPPTTTASNTTN